MLDEIFCEVGFDANIIWQKKYTVAVRRQRLWHSSASRKHAGRRARGGSYIVNKEIRIRKSHFTEPHIIAVLRQAKIARGEAHLKAFAVDKNPARYVKATKLDDVLSHT